MVVRSYEMGQGGISVCAPEQIDLGAFVVVGFAIGAPGKAFRFPAVVRNKRGFRYGLQFTGVSDAERSELARCLESFDEKMGGSLTDAAGV